MSKLKRDHYVEVPHEARTFISPEARKVAFKQIYEGYPKRYPNLKLLWAYLNYDPEYPIDYGLVFTGRNEQNTGDLILYLIEPLYSDRSTPSYKYCKQTKQTKRFFDSGVHDMVIMEKDKFYEYLSVTMELNRDKTSDKYWKTKDNAPELAKSLLDLALYDTRTGLVREEEREQLL